MSDDNASVNTDQPSEQDQKALQQLDETLAKEDPDFIKSVSDVEIDNAACSTIREDSMIEASLNSVPLFSKQAVLQTVDFKNNRRSVLLFWLAVLVVLSAIYVAFQTHFWDRRSSLFLTSFADWKVDVTDYNPLHDTQSFFDNPRLSKNVLELKKIFVNIKSSSDSSDNPMLAFSITVEGLSREVVIEIKDRESEFVDLAARVAEEYSYDELVATEGKIALSDKIVDVFNANLTTGQVRKVMYSTFILKN